MANGLIAYLTTASIPAGSLDLPVVPDQVLSQSGPSGLVAPWPLDIVGAYLGLGGATGYGRLNSPTLAQTVAPYIRPASGTVAPASNPPLQFLGGGALRFPAGESLRVQVVAESSLAGALALVFIQDRHEPIPAGPIYTLMFKSPASGATTPVSGLWTSSLLEWSDQLPAGKYAIIAMEYVPDSVSSNAGLAARLVLAGQTLRPGTLAIPGLDGQNSRYVYDRSFGVLGTFDSFAMPGLEVLWTGTTPATGFHGFVQVVKIADASGRPCACKGGR